MKAVIVQVVLYALAINSTPLDKETPLDSEYVDNSTINLKLLRITDDDVKIYFRNKEQPNNDVPLSPFDHEKLSSEGFSVDKETVLVIHGWKNSYKSKINTIISEAYLSKHDINLLVIDWSSVADNVYLLAVLYVDDIGEIIGNFIKRLQKDLNLNLDKTAIVGHSLGAHVAGVAGRTVGGQINYIVGLDPASPMFNILRRNIRLHSTDARFVQVIHTSVLGVYENMGHADYYANGVLGQPGCPIAIFDFRLCSHHRAYEYFGESIKSGGFKAQRCSSKLDLLINRCQGPQSHMGEFNIDKTANGMYYLETNSEPPYAKD
ncbi:lipoprotein lipase-like [Diabrotica undecimpunctata]|uniref:lipoprotein lipase-like n=1 Tax=Diabrotica undecimpunctata TaxID=50387 RepID=UPI003B641943